MGRDTWARGGTLALAGKKRCSVVWMWRWERDVCEPHGSVMRALEGERS